MKNCTRCTNTWEITRIHSERERKRKRENESELCCSIQRCYSCWWWWRGECYFALHWISRTHLYPGLQVFRLKCGEKKKRNLMQAAKIKQPRQNRSNIQTMGGKPKEEKKECSFSFTQEHTINRFKIDRIHSTLTLTTTTIWQHDKHAYARDLTNS